MSSRKEQLLAQIHELTTGPKRSLGQNFLISDQVIERILATALDFGDSGFWSKIPAPSAFIEIGPGLGALTEGILEGLADKFHGKECLFRVIELDREFIKKWRARGVEVIAEDALKVSWRDLRLPEGSRLVSNLPYQISSSLVIDRSVWPSGIGSMILMFQKEVARRIMAKEKTEDYGLLSVIAQLAWDIETVCDAGPRDFYPAPRVASRVLRFRRKHDAPAQEEFEGILKFTKKAYAHRRKLLVSNLLSGEARQKDQKILIEGLLEEMGFSQTVRAEELSPIHIRTLYNRIGRSAEVGF